MNLSKIVVLCSVFSMSLSFASDRETFDPFADSSKPSRQKAKENTKDTSDSIDSLDFNPFSSILNMRDLFFGNSLQGLTKQGFGGSDVTISQREDDNYRYVDIIAQGVNKENLNINIKDGMILLQGQIKKEKKEEDESGATHVVSSYTSSFMRSFPIPEGVDAINPTFDLEGESIVIKFKKLK